MIGNSDRHFLSCSAFTHVTERKNRVCVIWSLVLEPNLLPFLLHLVSQSIMLPSRPPVQNTAVERWRERKGGVSNSVLQYYMSATDIAESCHCFYILIHECLPWQVKQTKTLCKTITRNCKWVWSLPFSCLEKATDLRLHWCPLKLPSSSPLFTSHRRADWSPDAVTCRTTSDRHENQQSFVYLL